MTMEFRRIRDLREDSDRSQREVAELLYIRRTVYRQIGRASCRERV